MPALSDYLSGTISLTNGSVDFTGTSTGWLLAGFKEGDTIIDITGATEFMGVIATIDANGAGTLTKAWEGPTLVDVAYRMRYQPDGARVSAQARNLIELLGNGNVLALAGLSGSANQVPMFTGPGAMTLVPKTDLVSGANYDVQVADIAARAAYDGQAAGYAVLVADTGDGRAAIYSKNSATSGDWSDPAYVTGPVGPLPDVTVGTVTTGDPGTDAEVTATPTVDGVELDFTIPAGRGLTPLGDYNPATAYVLDDAVLYNGSTWIALQATTGNAPPTLPTTSNAYWQLLARQGIDGAGTVNSVVAGTGITVDNTDPTAPVVSAILHGRPDLVLSGSDLLLKPRDGNKLIIGGVTETIPSAGVSLAPTGLTPATRYYIYAYMSGATMTLEASETGHSTDSSTGVEIKTGDATRSLVGMVYVGSGPAFNDSALKRHVVSWFNRAPVLTGGVLTTGVSTGATSYTAINSTALQQSFLQWLGQRVEISITGGAAVSIAGAYVFTTAYYNGNPLDIGATISVPAADTVYPCSSSRAFDLATEGLVTVDLLGKVTSGTGYWDGGATPSTSRITLSCAVSN